jgi:hypothetical protein
MEGVNEMTNPTIIKSTDDGLEAIIFEDAADRFRVVCRDFEADETVKVLFVRDAETANRKARAFTFGERA